MELTWLGHACFRLRAADNQVVVTDPFPASLGLRPPPATGRPASVVTVSNPHPNHSYLEGVSDETRVLASPGEYQHGGISVRGIMTPLAQGVPQEQRNVAYSITLDGVTVCHLGDINAPITPRQVADLSPAEVLLVPVGGGCTLGLEEIFQVMENLTPKIVIPMHYSIPGVTVPLQGIEGFLRRMGSGQIEPQPRLSVTAANLPEDMRVVVLAPQARLA
jgi:L-ascorbate metabolism protein UlaG (beta-lactamase superfamily)